MIHTNWQGLLKMMEKIFAKKGPEILTGMGIAGMVSTTVLAVGATPEALRRLESKRKEVDREKLTIIETVKVVGVCYIPAAMTCAVSTACLIGASSVNSRRNAALATAYSLSETALTEYRAKVVETLGEKKERDIQDAVAREHLTQHAKNPSTVIMTGKGGTLCYDVLSKQEFTSDIETLRKIQNDMNLKMINGEMYTSVNDLLDELGLERMITGDDLGWNTDRTIDMHFSAELKNGTPCVVIQHRNLPFPGYKSY